MSVAKGPDFKDALKILLTCQNVLQPIRWWSYFSKFPPGYMMIILSDSSGIHRKKKSWWKWEASVSKVTEWPTCVCSIIDGNIFIFHFKSQAEFKGCNYRYVVESGKWLDVQSGDTCRKFQKSALSWYRLTIDSNNKNRTFLILNFNFQYHLRPVRL